MTSASYNRLMNALIQQRREVAASPEAAGRLIDELGIREFVDALEVSTNRTASKKVRVDSTLPLKVTSKKVLSK